MFAAPIDMEPGMPFRTHSGGSPLVYAGVERVVSRFAGKSRVRVLVERGTSFVVDRDRKFQIIEWEARR